VRYKPVGKLLFKPEHIGRLIDVLLATAIAANFERHLDRRARGDRVGLG
jgi:hypothetical protein